LTPEELVRLAKEVGLGGLSITDHDTVSAYQTAIPVAKELGMRLGSGVEFSTMFETLSVHILGYDIALDSAELHTFCKRHQERREDRNRVILEKLTQKGMPISMEEITKGPSTIGRPHIALAMIAKGYVKSIREAFQIHIGDDKPCYYPGESFSTEETIALIHRLKGKAFLAHPHLLEHGKKIKRLLQLPFNGLECRYAKFTADQEQRWIKIAKEKGLLTSGGSDFHGASKDYIQLGCSWVTQEVFDQIFQHPLV
jgi:hypothetical protein